MPDPFDVLRGGLPDACAAVPPGSCGGCYGCVMNQAVDEAEAKLTRLREAAENILPDTGYADDEGYEAVHTDHLSALREVLAALTQENPDELG